MPLTRAELFARLDALGIKTETVEHAAVFTVEDSTGAGPGLPGADTKNLFLKDDRGGLVLIVAKSTAKVDIKGLARKLGTGRLSFGKPELLLEVLGVTPGAVTAFAPVNDVNGRVRVILDQELLIHDTVNCHPLENTATTNIALDDLLRFIRATGHEPQFVALAGARRERWTSARARHNPGIGGPEMGALAASSWIRARPGLIATCLRLRAQFPSLWISGRRGAARANS
jgi:Ala-tRNA(Pro) deacylase